MNKKHNKKPFYNKEIFNGGEIPWIDYVNLVLYNVAILDDLKKGLKYFNKTLANESNKSKKKELSELIAKLKDKSESVKIERDRLIKFINDSNANKNAKGMVNSFVKEDTTSFIKHFEDYFKIQYDKEEKEDVSFDEYFVNRKEECKNSWFMVKYLLDKKDRLFLEYMKS